MGFKFEVNISKVVETKNLDLWWRISQIAFRLPFCKSALAMFRMFIARIWGGWFGCVFCCLMYIVFKVNTAYFFGMMFITTIGGGWYGSVCRCLMSCLYAYRQGCAGTTKSLDLLYLVAEISQISHFTITTAEASFPPCITDDTQRLSIPSILQLPQQPLTYIWWS